MLDTTTYNKIPRVVETKDDLDFQYLKELGLEYIQSIGGDLWTDFNAHDPGVTLLEMLCYAISDLSARIDMPIEDLLAPSTGTIEKDQFHRASDILPSTPVTELDYRKLFMDITGVRNCWILPFQQTMYADCKNNQLSYTEADFVDTPKRFVKPVKLKGLYSIYLDYEPDHFKDFDTKAAIEQEKTNIRKRVWEKYHDNRNICEDLVDIQEVGEKKISICANIELDKTADKNEVHARIERAIEDYFTPSVKYYSLQQMLDKGYRTDEIFEGPVLSKGFIDNDELADADLRTSVRLSDIVRIIMAIDGVTQISSINLRDCDNPDGDKWIICIDQPFTKPILAPTSYDDGETPDCPLTSVFNYYKDVLPVTFNRSKVDQIKDALYQEELEEQMKASLDRVLTIPEGTFRSPSDTTTIQNDFPMTYGIGLDGLPGGSSTERKSQALQLKAYITVFDQILASYFSHLGKVRDLFAMNSGNNPTYFTQAIKDIKDFDKIVEDYPTNNDQLLSEKLIAFLDENIDRRDEILNHLISRFAEKFNNYTFLMTELFGDAADELIVQAKEQFLQEYISLSGNRFQAYNIQGGTSNLTWETTNVSGTQMRIARLAGMRDYSRRDLSNAYVSIKKVKTSTDPDPEVFEYRWVVKEKTNTEIIMHINARESARQASRDMYRSTYLLINSNITTLENTFANSVSDGQIIEKIQVLESGGTYGFKVIDTENGNEAMGISFEETSPGVYNNYPYASQTDLLTAVTDFIKYLKREATEEGIYLVEHILLRPNADTPSDITNPDGELQYDDNKIPIRSYMPICADDCQDSCELDPYSFRVSIILPGYTKRFADVDFRLYMENLIAREIPAHILPRVCWIGFREGEHVEVDPDTDAPMNELMDFEMTYKALLDSLKTSRETNTVITNGTDEEIIELDGTGKNNLIEFIKVFTRLHTIHHVGRLHNCESEDVEDSIILGRTNLGSL